MRKVCTFLGRLLLCVAVAALFGYGFYGLVTYALPLSKGDYRQARLSEVSSEIDILINGGCDAYEKGDLPQAVKVLELTIEKIIDLGGTYEKSNGWKLERIHFILGKCYQKAEVFEKAIQHYEDTLRLNPRHMEAKYNLEMIQPQGGDGGGGDKKPDAGKIKPKI